MARQKGIVNAATKLRFDKAAKNQFDDAGVPSIIKDLNNVLRGKEPVTEKNVKATLQLLFKGVKFRDDDGGVDRDKIKEFAEKRGYIPQAGKSYATTNLSDIITFFELLVTNSLSGKSPALKVVEDKEDAPPPKPAKVVKEPKPEKEVKLAKKRGPKSEVVEPKEEEDESVTVMALLNKKLYELERRMDKLTDLIATLLPKDKEVKKIEEGTRTTKSGKVEKITKIDPAELEEPEDRFEALSEKYDLSKVTEGAKLFEAVETLNDVETKRIMINVLHEIFLWPVDRIEEDFVGLTVEQMKEIIVDQN